ncbi:MAG: F0F1 ATP synthase subunit delta [Candidatus Dasytiphilus stammeri]
MKQITELQTIARPYAIAAFEFATIKDKINKWQHMLSLSAEISRNRNITQLLYGVLAPKILYKIFITLCGNNIEKEFKNFIRIMAENNRIQLLPVVLKIFKQLRLEYQQITYLEVITATPINSEQLTAIKKIIEEKLVLKVRINLRINKFILAGIIIRMGNTVIDGSLRSRLSRLEEFLLS